MRFLSVTLSIFSVVFLCLTMVAGLKAGHGQEFYMSHLYWGISSLAVVMLTLALCLMFIFKMHSIMHDLVRRLDEKFPEEGSALQ